MGAGFLIGVVGLLILSHAAYSTVQYRSLLKITDEEFSGPPIHVVMELIAGLALCMWAALTVPGNFLSILPHSDENSGGELTHQSGFHDLQPSWKSISI
ncbi:hypothetical protein OROGR_017634 [Orobanche gracilis]